MRCSTFYFHVVVTLSVLAPASLSIAVPDAILPSPSMESYLLRLLYMDVRMPRWTDAMERPCSRPGMGEGIKMYISLSLHALPETIGVVAFMVFDG